MKTQSIGEKFKCIFCEKTFKKFMFLDNHTRIHTDEKPFECKRCSYSVNQPSNLTTHMRTHTGQRPYECHVCNKAFIRSDHLKTHLRTHTGEKPYKCELCGQFFARMFTLQTHIRTHTLEKPYKCEICNKRFPVSASMKIHQAKIHNIDPHKFVIKCVFCTKEVFRKEHYFRHVRSQIYERPHLCRDCSCEFVRNITRKGHEMKLCKTRCKIKRKLY